MRRRVVLARLLVEARRTFRAASARGWPVTAGAGVVSVLGV